MLADFFSSRLQFDCHQVPPNHYPSPERFPCLFPHIVSFGDRIEMRQHEPADSGRSSHLPTLTGMQMDRARPISREGTVQHCEIDVSTETHEAVTVLRIAGIGQSFPAIFDSIPQAMEVLRVGHSSGYHRRRFRS